MCTENTFDTNRNLLLCVTMYTGIVYSGPRIPTLKGFRIKGPNSTRYLFYCVYLEYLKVTGEATIYYFVALRTLLKFKSFTTQTFIS